MAEAQEAAEGLDGKLVVFVRELLKVLPLKKRAQMRLVASGVDLLVDETPTIFDKAFSHLTLDGELKFRVESKGEESKIPMDMFIKFMMNRRSEISQFKFHGNQQHAENMFRTLQEGMQRSNLRSLMIKDFSWFFTEDNQEIGIQLIQLINSSNIEWIRIGGEISHNLLGRIYEMEQCKKSRAVEVNNFAVNFVDTAKRFNKFQVSLNSVTDADSHTVIQSFREQKRPRLAKFLLSTESFGVDKAIVERFGGRLVNASCILDLSLDYSKSMILRVLVCHHIVRGVVCLRGNEDEDFGPIERTQSIRFRDYIYIGPGVDHWLPYEEFSFPSDLISF